MPTHKSAYKGSKKSLESETPEKISLHGDQLHMRATARTKQFLMVFIVIADFLITDLNLR
jgi:hypothetical protein